MNLAFEDFTPWDLVVLVTRGFVEVDSEVAAAVVGSRWR